MNKKEKIIEKVKVKVCRHKWVFNNVTAKGMLYTCRKCQKTKFVK